MSTSINLTIKSILSIQSTRAEVYSTLLREVSSINEAGVDQLNQYCKQAITSFQQLSKQIRLIEASLQSLSPKYANIISSIQSFEQQKFKLVVTYLQQQVALFSSTCPFDHSHPPPTDSSAFNWRVQTLKQYLSDDELNNSLFPSDLDYATNTPHALTDHDHTHPFPQELEMKPLPCTHPHHHDYADDYDPFEAQQQTKLAFTIQVAELDNELNEIADELRSDLIDLTDQ